MAESGLSTPESFPLDHPQALLEPLVSLICNIGADLTGDRLIVPQSDHPATRGIDKHRLAGKRRDADEIEAILDNRSQFVVLFLSPIALEHSRGLLYENIGQA